MNLEPTRAKGQPPHIGRNLAVELVRVTERAAIAAAGWRGKGDERAADQAAVQAMHTELGKLQINGRVIIGEGAESEVDALYVGEKLGTGEGQQIDIAADPLEGNSLVAKNQHDALCVLAVAEPGGLLQVPNVYMTKIAIGAGYPEGIVDLDASAEDNIKALADFRKVAVTEITTCVLDRPRHGKLIGELRELGVSVRLIGDGDIAGVIHAAHSDESGIDIYLGSGGAAEGILAAAALRCFGGQMQARLILDNRDKVASAKALGITDPSRKYELADMAGGDVVFSATGVTDGSLMGGVKMRTNYVQTSTIVTRAWSGSLRWITARHKR